MSVAEQSGPQYGCSYPGCPAYYEPLSALGHDPDGRGIPTGWHWPAYDPTEEVEEDPAFSNHDHTLNDGSRPSIDFQVSDDFVAVLFTGGNAPFRIRQRVRIKEGNLGEGREGTIVGWAAGRKAFQRWVTSGCAENLVDNEGPLVDFPGAPVGWFPGQAITTLEIAY